MCAQKADIAVKIGVDGEDEVARSLDKVRQASDRTSAPMVDDLPQLRDVAATIGKIGLATAAIGGAGLAAFNAALGKSKDIAADVAQQLIDLDNASTRLGSESAENIGGFAFAAQAAGWNGLSDTITVGNSLLEVAKKVRDHDEATVEAMHKIRSYYKDIFEYDVQTGRFDGLMQGADVSILNLVRRLEEAGASSKEIVENLQPLIGRDSASKIASLVEMGADDLEEMIDYYDYLTGFSQEDLDSAKTFQSSMATREAAILGMKNAFSRHMWPVLTESNERFAEFSVKNRARIEELGGAFADFNVRARELFGALGEQALISATGDFERVDGSALRDVLRAQESGDAAAVGDRDIEMARKIVEQYGEIRDEIYVLMEDGSISIETPMMRYTERLTGLMTGYKTVLMDVMEYMSSGSTDAPWLEAMIGFFEKIQSLTKSLKDEITDFADIVSERVMPAIDGFIESVNGLLGYFFGIDNKIATGAVIAGALFFSRTLISLAQLMVVSLGVLTQAGIGLAGLGIAASGAGGAAAGAAAGMGVGAAVAAGGAALGGVGAAAWMTSGTNTMEKDLEYAQQRAEKLAAEHGEAYAAAYLQAVIDHQTESNSGFSAANWLAGKLGLGADFEGAKADLSGIMQGASEDELLGGYAEAIRDFGLEVEAGEKVKIGAELEVRSFQLDAAARQQVEDMLRVDLTASGLASAISPQPPDIGAEMERALRNYGVAPSAGQTPVIIQMPGGEEIPGFAGSPDAISQLSRAASAAARSRS